MLKMDQFLLISFKCDFDSERTRVLLTSAAYVHLNHLDVSKHTRNLSPASRAILLSGPAGMDFSFKSFSTLYVIICI